MPTRTVCVIEPTVDGSIPVWNNTTKTFGSQGADGTTRVQSPSVESASQAEGFTRTTEAQLKTTDSSAQQLTSFTIPTNSMVIYDVEVLAIRSDRVISGWWKKSLAFLNNSGAVTAGTQRAVDSEFIGGTPTWTVTLDNSGTTARVMVNGQGNTVTWYVLSQAMKIVPAP